MWLNGEIHAPQSSRKPSQKNRGFNMKGGTTPGMGCSKCIYDWIIKLNGFILIEAHLFDV